MIRRTDKSNTILVKVHDSDDVCCTTDYAIIVFDDTLINKINLLKKHFDELKEVNKILYQIQSFDYSCYYISNCDYDGVERSSDEIMEQLEETDIWTDGWCFIEPIENIEEVEGLEILSMDGETIKVREHSIAFDASIRHTTTSCWTTEILFSDLNKHFGVKLKKK